MGWLKKHWSFVTIGLLVLAAAIVRLRTYGDIRLSIANNDTASYAASGDVPILSWEAFTGRRVFTTNLVYHVFRPEGGDYKILVNGSTGTKQRGIQPTFIGIVILQAIFSLLGWSALAVAAALQFKDRLLSVLVALSILCFGFMPQLADWDSVLSSESLTFSLFALQFALLILLAFRVYRHPAADRWTILLAGLWLVVVFFWTFLKDGNLYNLLVDGVAIGALLLFRSFRKQKLVYAVVGMLAAFFLLGWITSGQSSRMQVQLLHVYQANIVPLPARADFVKALGMPRADSPRFDTWFQKNAKGAYLRFLLAHPGYVASMYTADSLRAFDVNVQPYFSAPGLAIREALISPGNMLHLIGPSSLLVDALLLLGIWLVALRKRPEGGLVWAWLATWLYVSAQANLFITIFGDAYGLTRHALPAAAMLRVFIWLFGLVLIELALTDGASKAVPTDAVAA